MDNTSLNDLRQTWPSRKWNIGDTIVFCYAGRVSNREQKEGIVVGYDGQDRLLADYIMTEADETTPEPIYHRGASVHIHTIIELDASKWLKLSDFMLPSDKFDKNYYAPKKQGFDHCAFCGKHVADRGGMTAWIEHTTSGLLIPKGVEVPIEGLEDTYQGHQSQGCFPVGPECERKVPGYVRHHRP